ncbi:hypothetical protein FHS16_003754 [Paenibacillus endophyticus]|uniref:Uncharacterized protein n=1 Tax=Paenibacillus endophyticus TaxID=1294268 RepID=A0A7W5CBD6_9BACL|nr:hypothetical protein [Paenibacillus endophyticus]MBB3153679.1 hypothetical protein [Paenibacillus endophyticus]
MSDGINKKLPEEVKDTNARLGSLNEPRGLSAPMKLIALVLGFIVIGPLLVLLLSQLFI